MAEPFEQQVAQATMDMFNEWMRLGDQRPTWMIFIAPRIAAAIQAICQDAEAGGWQRRDIGQEIALACLRGRSDV